MDLTVSDSSLLMAWIIRSGLRNDISCASSHALNSSYCRRSNRCFKKELYTLRGACFVSMAFQGHRTLTSHHASSTKDEPAVTGFDHAR